MENTLYDRKVSLYKSALEEELSSILATAGRTLVCTGSYFSVQTGQGVVSVHPVLTKQGLLYDVVAHRGGLFTHDLYTVTYMVSTWAEGKNTCVLKGCPSLLDDLAVDLYTHDKGATLKNNIEIT